MPSYAIVNFDTTSPDIVIYAPKHTTDKTINRITIEGSETLSSYQDIFVIDNDGNRYDYLFKKENDTTYVGYIRFTGLVGTVTLYALVEDEVGNRSKLISFPINVLDESTSLLKLKIKDYDRNLYTKITEYSKIGIKDTGVNVKIYDKEV